MSQQFAHYSSCLHRLTANHCACNVWKMAFINIMQGGEKKKKQEKIYEAEEPNRY